MQQNLLREKMNQYTKAKALRVLAQDFKSKAEQRPMYQSSFEEQSFLGDVRRELVPTKTIRSLSVPQRLSSLKVSPAMRQSSRQLVDSSRILAPIQFTHGPIPTGRYGYAVVRIDCAPEKEDAELLELTRSEALKQLKVLQGIHEVRVARQRGVENPQIALFELQTECLDLLQQMIQDAITCSEIVDQIRVFEGLLKQFQLEEMSKRAENPKLVYLTNTFNAARATNCELMREINRLDQELSLQPEYNIKQFTDSIQQDHWIVRELTAFKQNAVREDELAAMEQLDKLRFSLVEIQQNIKSSDLYERCRPVEYATLATSYKAAVELSKAQQALDNPLFKQFEILQQIEQELGTIPEPARASFRERIQAYVVDAERDQAVLEQNKEKLVSRCKAQLAQLESDMGQKCYADKIRKLLALKDCWGKYAAAIDGIGTFSELEALQADLQTETNALERYM